MKLLSLLSLAGPTVALLGCTAANQASEPKVYFGNLHSHTCYSDGSGTPDDAYRHARHVAKLDFLAVTEHNHIRAEDGAGERKDGILIARTPRLYTGPGDDALIPTAQRWTENGKFVALYGQEFSSISAGNHVNVFDVPEVITAPNGKFNQLLDWIGNHHDSSGQRAIIQFNHPKLFNDDSKEYGADDFASQAEWIGKMDADTQLIEILNGPAMKKDGGHRPEEVMEKDYLAYLNLGFHLAPTADQDNHYFTWGTTTDARTGVIAEELTKAQLYAAMRARHVYATEDKNLRIIIKVNGHLCGDRISPPPATGSNLDIRYQIIDDDEPDATYRVSVFSDLAGGPPAQVVNAITVPGQPGGVTGQIEDVACQGAGQFVFFKIEQADEDGEPDRAWTAPVWFEDASAAPPSGRDGEDESQLVASRKSDIYHVSHDCRSAKSIKDSNKITGPDAKKGRRKHDNCPL